MIEDTKKELKEKISALNEEYRKELKQKKHLEKQYKKLDKRSAEDVQKDLMRNHRRMTKLQNSIETYEGILDCLNKELDIFAVNKIFLAFRLYGMPEIIRYKQDELIKRNKLKDKVKGIVHSALYFGIIGAAIGIINVNIIPFTATAGAILGAVLGNMHTVDDDIPKPLSHEDKLAILKEVDKERGLRNIFQKLLKKKKEKLGNAKKKEKKLNRALRKTEKRFEMKENLEEEIALKEGHLEFLSDQKAKYLKEYSNILEAEEIVSRVVEDANERHASEDGYSYVKKDKAI